MAKWIFQTSSTGNWCKVRIDNQNRISHQYHWKTYPNEKDEGDIKWRWVQEYTLKKREQQNPSEVPKHPSD